MSGVVTVYSVHSLFLSKKKKFSNSEWKLWNNAILGYHSNDMSSVNTLHERKLCSRSEWAISLLFLTSNAFLWNQIAYDR
jgi:hypothetical protein